MGWSRLLWKVAHVCSCQPRSEQPAFRFQSTTHSAFSPVEFSVMWVVREVSWHGRCSPGMSNLIPIGAALVAWRCFCSQASSKLWQRLGWRGRQGSVLRAWKRYTEIGAKCWHLDTAAPGGDSELGFLANEKGVTDTCRGVHMHEQWG